MPRRLVAVGNLDKVWFLASEDVDAAEFYDGFQGFFGADWTEVLNVAEKSFDYIAGNDVFFSISDLQPLKNLTLEQLLEKRGMQRPPNIIVS